MVAIGRSMRDLVDTNGGRVSREIFCSQEIYDQEMEQIFARSWLFVGHESQIPKSGDFMRSRMGEESVIVTRDKQNQIHVLLNSCRHRGNLVCRYDQGNALAFTCSFHGWVYDTSGALVALPNHEGGYDGMPKEDWGLLRARVEVFQGSIWATWDHTAPTFIDYLGGAEVYLATGLLHTDGSDNGAEVLGGVLKWRLGCNWKVPSPDKDSTHGWITHRSIAMALGVGPTGTPVKVGEGQSVPARRRTRSGWERAGVSFPEGHTFSMGPIPKEDDPSWADSGVWDGLPVVREYLREQYEIRKKRLGRLASLTPGPAIFPNEGWLGRVIRIMHPQGPTMTEIWTFFFVDKDAPPEVKSALGHHYEQYYGPGGVTQKDDMENWYQLTIASKGPMARKLGLNYQLGLSDPPRHGPSTYGLPGLFSKNYSDETHRGFYQRWAEVMDARDWDEMRIKNPVK